MLQVSAVSVLPAVLHSVPSASVRAHASLVPAVGPARLAPAAARVAEALTDLGLQDRLPRGATTGASPDRATGLAWMRLADALAHAPGQTEAVGLVVHGLGDALARDVTALCGEEGHQDPRGGAPADAGGPPPALGAPLSWPPIGQAALFPVLTRLDVAAVLDSRRVALEGLGNRLARLHARLVERERILGARDRHAAAWGPACVGTAGGRGAGDGGTAAQARAVLVALATLLALGARTAHQVLSVLDWLPAQLWPGAWTEFAQVPAAAAPVWRRLLDGYGARGTRDVRDDYLWLDTVAAIVQHPQASAEPFVHDLVLRPDGELEAHRRGAFALLLLNRPAGAAGPQLLATALDLASEMCARELARGAGRGSGRPHAGASVVHPDLLARLTPEHWAQLFQHPDRRVRTWALGARAHRGGGAGTRRETPGPPADAPPS